MMNYVFDNLPHDAAVHQTKIVSVEKSFDDLKKQVEEIGRAHV